MLNEKYGRQSFKSSRNPFTCGISGKSYTVSQQAQRVELLARTLSKELGWQPNTGTEWEKVMGIFSLNTVRQSSQMHKQMEGLMVSQIDFMTLAYAVHELGGVVSPANAQYSAAELEFQLKSSQSKALFTVRFSAVTKELELGTNRRNSVFLYSRLPYKLPRVRVSQMTEFLF